MKKTIFCIECRQDNPYHIHSIEYHKIIRDKEYYFTIYEALCDKCGQRVNIPGLIDFNANEIDKQYRAKENIVSIEEINDLMKIYNIGKNPLSLALGFGDITITRYLLGQIPSKEYSNIIRKALESPTFMKEQLNKHHDKIGDTAYKKAMRAAKELEPIFALSKKMLLTISYIFKKANEVTPLALQKLLYYIQGIYLAKYHEELFIEDCEAWKHGPVFANVYSVFKSFKYNPVDDIRFSIFENRFNELSEKEKKIIDLVIESFGIYSGKTLEIITHQEKPWQNARANNLPNDKTNEIIMKESIKDYFLEVSQNYQIDSVEGLMKYINSKLDNIKVTL